MSDQYKKHRAHALQTALERLGSEGWLDKLGPAAILDQPPVMTIR